MAWRTLLWSDDNDRRTEPCVMSTGSIKLWMLRSVQRLDRVSRRTYTHTRPVMPPSCSTCLYSCRPTRERGSSRACLPATLHLWVADEPGVVSGPARLALTLTTCCRVIVMLICVYTDVDCWERNEASSVTAIGHRCLDLGPSVWASALRLRVSHLTRMKSAT